MGDYSSVVSGWDDAPESHGQTNEPMAAGWYPLVVIEAKVETLPSGVQKAALQLGVKEGAVPGIGGKRAFVDLWLVASHSKRDGNKNEIARTPEEIKKAQDSMNGQMKGFLKSIGVDRGHPTVGPEDPQFMAQFLNMHLWEGRGFMGELKVEKNEQYGDKNQLKAFFGMEDEKKGFGLWQTQPWGLAKLIAAMGRGSNSGGRVSASEATV